MDIGKFAGILPRSLLMPHKRRAFSQAFASNGQMLQVGPDIWTTGAMTAIHDTDGEWVDFATTGSTNSTNGIEGTVGGGNFSGRVSSLPLFFARVRLEQITNVRFWCGFPAFDGGSFMASDDPADSIAAFRFSTAAGDSEIMCYRNDGTSGGTAVGSGVTMQAGVVYELLVRFVTSGKIQWWINGALVLEASATNMPATTKDLGNICEIRTLANEIKHLRAQTLINAYNQ